MKKLLAIVVLVLLWCNTSFAENIVLRNKEDLKKLLLQKGLTFANTSISFFQDGTGTWKYGDTKYPINWQVFSKNSFAAVNPKYKKEYGKGSIVELDFKNMTATATQKSGELLHYKILSPIGVKTEIAKKPKKKKPKQTPDNNKIVAAASGTGFFVSRKGHIITNNHVIQGCDSVKVSFTGDELKAKTLAVDKMNDLAIIKANINPAQVYSVATQDASLLEDVIIAGFPLGKRVSSAIKTSKGSVTALAGYGDNFSEFQTDAALNQGNSGGPIMNQKGNVVGVAVANFGKKEGVESFNFGIKASTLRTFANSNGLKFLPPNRREMSNKDLGDLITNGTVYLECWMTVAKIKRMIAEANNRKAFFSEYQ